MPDVFPRDDSQLVVWYNNFQAKFATYIAALGFVAADATAVANDYAALAYMVQQVELSKVNTQDRVAYKDLLKNGPIGAVGGAYPGAFTPPAAPAVVVLPGIVPRLRLLIKRIKAAPAYTKAIGEDLGIVTNSPAPPIKVKPTGSARALPGSQVELKFVKKTFDGVQVESKRAAETVWSVLGNYLRSPIMDTRAPIAAGQPEVRQYRYRYLSGNDPVGDASDVLAVTTIP